MVSSLRSRVLDLWQDNINRNSKNLFFLTCIGTFIGIGLVSLFFYHRQIVQALTPQPETFTELYFEDHLNLPKRLVIGAPFNFAFTIHNLENKTVQYPIEISVQASDSADVIPLKYMTISLENNESKSMSLDMRLPGKISPRAKIVVDLLNLDQHIDFWADIATASATSSSILKR